MKSVESLRSRERRNLPQRGGNMPMSDALGESASQPHSGSEIPRSSRTMKLRRKRSKPFAVVWGFSRSNFRTVGKKCPKVGWVVRSSKRWIENEWNERDVTFLKAENWGSMVERNHGVIHIKDGDWTRRISRAWVVAKWNPARSTSEFEAQFVVSPSLPGTGSPVHRRYDQGSATVISTAITAKSHFNDSPRHFFETSEHCLSEGTSSRS